jgi:hypothetical protein
MPKFKTLQKVLIYIFFAGLFLISLEHFSGLFLLKYNRYDLRLNTNALREFDSNLKYHIRKNAFLPDGQPKYITESKLQGFLSYDEKEGLLRTSAGDILINKWGFRNSYFEKKAANDVYRIISVGDSTTVGNFENELTYPSILQRMLNQNQGDVIYEVLNTGHWGYNSCQLKKLYINEISNLSPKVILLSNAWNDRSLVRNKNIKNIEQYCRFSGQRYYEKFKIFIFFEYLFGRFFYQSPPPFDGEIYESPFKIYKENIINIIEDTRSKGVKIGLFDPPGMHEDITSANQLTQYPHFVGKNLKEIEFDKKWLIKVRQFYKKLARDYDHVFYISDIGLSSSTSGKHLFFPDSIHPSGSGNRILAYKIYEKLIRELGVLTSNNFLSKNDHSKNQKDLEVLHLKSIFAASRIEDISYSACLALHKQCVNTPIKNRKLIQPGFFTEYAPSIVEFTLGSILQFKNQVSNPEIKFLFEKILNLAISKQPDFASPYWVLGQLYRIWGSEQKAKLFLNQAFELNPHLKKVSFDRNFKEFRKNFKSLSVFENLNLFVSTLKRAPNYRSPYTYFLSLIEKKGPARNKNIDLFRSAFYASTMLSHSILSSLINYLVSIDEKGLALTVLKDLRVLKPEFNHLYEQYELAINRGVSII